MFKNKVLAIMAVLVLALAVIAISCAPAAEPAPTTPPAVVTPPAETTPPAVVTPPAVETPPAEIMPPAVPEVTAPPEEEKATSFESQKFTDEVNGFSVRYPAAWKEAAKLPFATAVLAANDGSGPPPQLIIADIRPGTSVKDASIATVKDLIASYGLSVSPTVDSENTVMLADGKTSATELVISMSVMFQTKKSYALGIIKDGNVITIHAGVDQAKLPLYKEIVETLTVK